MNHKPPVLADRIFRWYCNNAMIEDLHGDVEEIFYDNLKRMSATRAKFYYWRQVLSLMLSYAVKKRKSNASFHPYSTSTNYLDMFRNYIKIALRSLSKHRFFTSLNVIGLAIGMSIALLFVAMVSYVSRYDNFHKDGHQIYRVVTSVDDLQRNYTTASAPPLLADKIQHELTGIESVVRINKDFQAEAVHDNKKIPLSGYFVDPQFLDVFTFPLAKGNSHSALSQSSSMLITEKAALKMFGNVDPVGQIITMGDFGDFAVTGVLKDHPRNSHMQFEVIAPYEALLAFERKNNLQNLTSWREFRNNYIYLKLPTDADGDRIQNFLNGVAEKSYAPFDDLKAQFSLQPMLDITPGPEMRNDIGPDWSYTSFVIFGVLTLMILLPACFNYASISMSRALKRSKEIGLRKVVGGQRHQIFMQFIMETIIITLMALAGAWLIFVFVKEEFLSMIISADTLDLSPDGLTILYFILFAIAVGILAGIFPALYYMKINPVEALKKQTSLRALRGVNLRRVLIVGQFAISLGFIMAVVIVSNQYRTVINYDFGFEQSNILDVQLKTAKVDVFRNEFSRLSSVQKISMSSNILGTSAAGSEWVSESGFIDSVEVSQMFVDENYLNNMGLELIAGTNFIPGSEARKHVIVNEEFLKSFKISGAQDALNRTFLIKGDSSEEIVVAGVVRNFHYASLREPIRNFFFRYDPSKFAYANLKVKANDMVGAIAEMESVWGKLNTEEVFTSKFFADEIQDTYDFYFSMIKICGFMGLLAISISCLGLLGMVVYTVEMRTKEVGVRKVMGATDGNVVFLLSKDFLRLMIIAAVVAIPTTYILFDKLFLSVLSYYSFGISVVDIVISLLIMILLGGVTILSQTVKAARANPVDTLRYE